MRLRATIGLVLAVQAANAQSVPLLPAGDEIVSGLSDASSVRLDPVGLVYIADPGRHVIDIRTEQGALVQVLGGPGTGQGQFDSPMDVDPTNGLLLAVADAGNSRIVRFRTPYQVAEIIPLYGSSRETREVSTGLSGLGESGDDLSPGRPTRVALGESNETFAIDDVRNVVAKWDISRKLTALIGNEADDRALRHPVDIEILGDQLCVADGGVGSIIVFDLFGGRVAEYGGGLFSNLRGLGTDRRNLWVLHDDQVSVVSLSGGLQSRYRLPGGMEAPVDIAVSSSHLLVLTRHRLLGWSLGLLEGLPLAGE